MKSEVKRNSLHKNLLRQGFEHWEGNYPGGQRANNRLTLDYEVLYEDNLALLNLVMERLCEQTKAHNPKFVVGVQEKEKGYVTKVAGRLKIQAIRLKQKNIHGVVHLSYATALDEHAATKLKQKNTHEQVELSHGSELEERAAGELSPQGVLIQGVKRDSDITRAALEFNGIGPKLVAEVVIFDRSLPANGNIGLQVPTHSLAAEPIPANLQRSELWQFAK